MQNNARAIQKKSIYLLAYATEAPFLGGLLSLRINYLIPSIFFQCSISESLPNEFNASIRASKKYLENINYQKPACTRASAREVLKPAVV